MNQPTPAKWAVPPDGFAAALDVFSRLIDDRPDLLGASPDGVKGCCAAAYGLDAIGLFLGDSYHPGGRALTTRLADAMHLRHGQHVLDLACGIGTTALLLAQEQGVQVTGIDLGAVQVDQATARASRLGLDTQVQFQLGDAEHIPAADGQFDTVICECAFCTFPDKATAAAEIARVLTSGGKVGISDIWLEPGGLDPELAGIAGRIACLADAQPIAATKELLASSGFEVPLVERHDQALSDTIDHIHASLRALKIVAPPGLDRDILRRAITLAAKAGDLVARGGAGYYLMVAQSLR